MANDTRSYSISVIPGDGIGKEVRPEGIRVLEKTASRAAIITPSMAA